MKKLIIVTLTLILTAMITGCSTNNDGFKKAVEHDVMNGYGNEVIGTYITVDANGTEINEENLLSFYNEYVKDSGYNWVTLKLDNNTGIQFPGSLNFFYYGTLSGDDSVADISGEGNVNNDKIEYSKR